MLLAVSLPAQDLGTALDVGAMARASAPSVRGDFLILSYDFGPGSHEGRIHTVAAAFAHEEFSTLHPFARNDQNVYVLLYPLSRDLGEVRYRLVVDGIWTTDPQNPDTVEDRWGVRLSRTVVRRPVRPPTETPVLHPDGTVEFVLTASPGSHVTVAGSFNGWDPFMTPLREIAPGRFSRRLRLGMGEHLYYYVVDGLRLPDPDNSERRWHTSGRIVSVVSLP